jgi:nucleotide-binding universal stress UspA family protein
MHVLVATDGSIDVDRAASFASSLAGPDGSTTVATIVRVPRSLVTDLRQKYGESATPSVDVDAEYVENPPAGGAVRKSWPGEDALIDQYLGDKRIEFCRPIVEAIREGGGEATSVVREGDDPASDIIALAEELGAEAIVVGSHGHGGFQGLLGSTGSKLVRRSPCPVLVVR